MAKPTKLQVYMQERADYFESLEPSELKAYEETLKDRNEILNDVTNTKNFLNGDANEFERMHSSFFAVSISLIIAGMLSNHPTPGSTMAARVFFFCSITFAVAAAACLFLEFNVTKRAFVRWRKHVQEIADYTNSSNWTPDTFGPWVKKHNAKAEEQTPNVYFQAEVLLLFISFTFMLFWLIEILFNPNWLFFK